MFNFALVLVGSLMIVLPLLLMNMSGSRHDDEKTQRRK